MDWGWPRRAVTAAALVAAAAGVSWAFHSILGREGPFLFAMLAILGTAYWAGFRAAVVVTVISTLAIGALLFRQSVHASLLDELIPPVVFAAIGLGTSWFIAARRKLVGELVESHRILEQSYQREREQRLELDRLAEQLGASERRYRTVATVTRDALWDWDVPLNRIDWTDGISRVFGYKPEEISTDPQWWQNRIHADDRDRVVSALRATLAGLDEVWSNEFRFRCGDGSYANVMSRGKIIRSPSGAPLRVIGSMLDLTEQKRVEKALAESHRFGRRLLRSVPSPVVMIDAKANIVVFNRACEQLSGYRRREVVGKPLAELLVPDDGIEFERRMADPFAPEASEPHECRWRTRSGEIRVVEWQFTVVPAPNGGLPYLLGAGTDVTERRPACADSAH
jgi:PAS domain S-box-containing protein